MAFSSLQGDTTLPTCETERISSPVLLCHLDRVLIHMFLKRQAPEPRLKQLEFRELL